MTPLLEARDLSVGHEQRVVARGVGLALRAGEVMCLLGPNGGGKTTLLRTLLGLIPPLAGEVRLGGVDLRSLPRREVATRLAYVLQAAPGGFAYPAREVVAMGRAARVPLLAAPGRRDQEAADAALARLGIAHLAGRPVTELSGGAAAGAHRPRASAGGRLPGAGQLMASLGFGNQALVLR